MSEKIVVGLDIGTTKICAIVGSQGENGKINILGLGKTESNGAVMRGMVSNIDRTAEAISYAIQQASQKSMVDIKTVHVGIAGQHIKSLHLRSQITRDNEEEMISQQDVDRLINDIKKIPRDPGVEIIHIFPQDYNVDQTRGVKDPVGMPGVQLEGNFHIITGQINAVRNIQKCVEKAGLNIADLILEPVASSESVLYEEEKEAGVALVDIGGGTTDIAIFQDGVIRHTAVIPLGGEIITQDIMTGCNVMRKQAETMKVKFGHAFANEAHDNEIITIPGIRGNNPREITVKNLSLIIQARVEEIFEHVYFEIKSSGFEKKLQGGIVLTGGGSQLKNMRQLVEYVTGITARVGYPTERLGKGLVKEVGLPIYATGIGLVLHGFKTQDGEGTNKKINEKDGKGRGKTLNILERVKTWLSEGNDYKD